MCGIYGCIGDSYTSAEGIFSETLRHRGPDDNGYFIDNRHKLALGHTRLSVIDLSSHAHQPMSDESDQYKGYTLVFNGEIYNYPDLKSELRAAGHKFSTQSDTEVVLKSYKEWGERCLEKFRGMFAFCIYDRPRQRLFLARDRFGIKPLLYSFMGNQFLFSSELKPFMQSGLIPKRLSSESVCDYFRYGSVRQPKTILDGVYHLMPGHFMRVRLDLNYEIECYYNLVKESSKQSLPATFEDAVKRTREVLEEATRYHMVADVDVGAFLSGGVDSTAVVAMMQRYSAKPINTFSLGFRHKTDVVDETDIAGRTASFLGTHHQNIKIDDRYIVNIFDDFISALDQPSIDGINTYIVSLEASKDLKVALSGLGGDEIFAGYPHFGTITNYSKMPKSMVSYVGKHVNKLRPNRITNKFELIGVPEEVGLDSVRRINRRLDSILKNPGMLPSIELYDGLSPLQKISKAEIDHYMLCTLLRDNDVLSMAHSLEVRPVLLDHRLVELAFNLNDGFKIRNGKFKSVFIESVKNLIPSEVWQRKKTGFEMPCSGWMNGVLNDRAQDCIEGNYAKEYLSPTYLKSLNKRVRTRTLQRYDWTSFIFLIWCEKYGVEA